MDWGVQVEFKQGSTSLRFVRMVPTFHQPLRHLVGRRIFNPVARLAVGIC